MTALTTGDHDDVRTAVRRAFATAHIPPVTEEQLMVVIDVLKVLGATPLERSDAYEEGYADGYANGLLDAGAVAQ